MPVSKKKMDTLKKQYGSKKGKDVYYALENKQRSAKPKRRNNAR